MAIRTTEIKLLWGRAGGRCSLCDSVLTEEKAGGSAAYPIGECAHIVAEKDDGPRGKSALSKAERNRYDNLILLCPTCHTRVDRAPEDYTVKRLRETKRVHEQKWGESKEVTPNSLAGHIDPSVQGVVDRVRRVFSAHGILPPQWSRFLRALNAPFTIDLQALQNDATLLRWLDEDKLQWIAGTFLIEREWLDGHGSEVQEDFYFDKRPALFFSTVGRCVDALIWDKAPTYPEAYFIRCGRGSEWTDEGESEVLVVIRVPMAVLGRDNIVYKYISDLEGYSWTYPRTHLQLRAWARLLFVNKDLICFGCDLPLAVARQVNRFTEDRRGATYLRRLPIEISEQQGGSTR